MAQQRLCCCCCCCWLHLCPNAGIAQAWNNIVCQAQVLPQCWDIGHVHRYHTPSLWAAVPEVFFCLVSICGCGSMCATGYCWVCVRRYELDCCAAAWVVQQSAWPAAQGCYSRGTGR